MFAGVRVSAWSGAETALFVVAAGVFFLLVLAGFALLIWVMDR